MTENYKTPDDLKIGEGFCNKCGWRGNLSLLKDHICPSNLEEKNKALNDLMRGKELIWNQTYHKK